MTHPKFPLLHASPFPQNRRLLGQRPGLRTPRTMFPLPRRNRDPGTYSTRMLKPRTTSYLATSRRQLADGIPTLATHHDRHHPWMRLPINYDPTAPKPSLPWSLSPPPYTHIRGCTPYLGPTLRTRHRRKDYNTTDHEIMLGKQN